MAIVLLASDLASLRKELRTTLEGPDLLIEEVATAPKSSPVEEGGVDLVVLDLQMARWAEWPFAWNCDTRSPTARPNRSPC